MKLFAQKLDSIFKAKKRSTLFRLMSARIGSIEIKRKNIEVTVKRTPIIHEINYKCDIISCEKEDKIRVDFLLTLDRIVQRQSTRKIMFFKNLKSIYMEKKSQQISRIIFLLSKNFSQKVDSNFLSEKIKNLVLKNGIKNKELLQILKEKNITVSNREYRSEEEIRSMGLLLSWFNTIELMNPVDLYVTKIRQSHDRAFMRNLMWYIAKKQKQSDIRKFERCLAIFGSKSHDLRNHSLKILRKNDEKKIKSIANYSKNVLFVWIIM